MTTPKYTGAREYGAPRWKAHVCADDSTPITYPFDETDYRIAEAYDVPGAGPEERKANARLIANAPRLERLVAEAAESLKCTEWGAFVDCLLSTGWVNEVQRVMNEIHDTEDWHPMDEAHERKEKGVTDFLRAAGQETEWLAEVHTEVLHTKFDGDMKEKEWVYDNTNTK